MHAGQEGTPNLYHPFRSGCVAMEMKHSCLFVLFCFLFVFCLFVMLVLVTWSFGSTKGLSRNWVSYVIEPYVVTWPKTEAKVHSSKVRMYKACGLVIFRSLPGALYSRCCESFVIQPSSAMLPLVWSVYFVTISIIIAIVTFAIFRRKVSSCFVWWIFELLELALASFCTAISYFAFASYSYFRRRYKTRSQQKKKSDF